MMEKQDDRLPEASMDPANLFREDIYTDRRVGTIRVLTPVKSDGSPDPGRKPVYIGEVQLVTAMGALPLSFDIEADSFAGAVTGYGPAAKTAFERAMREVEDLRRQAASSLVIPRGVPGGGKIQLP